jgi:hypothetical protein
MNYTKEERLQLANDVIRVLNSAVECDKTAMHKLTEFRVRCNETLAQHPTIQVRTEKESNSSGAAALIDVHRVGLLGILNGILGTDDFKQAYLAGSYDDEGKLIKFQLNGNLGKKP